MNELPTTWPWPWWRAARAPYAPATAELPRFEDEGRSTASLLDSLPADHWLSGAEPSA